MIIFAIRCSSKASWGFCDYTIIAMPSSSSGVFRPCPRVKPEHSLIISRCLQEVPVRVFSTLGSGSALAHLVGSTIETVDGG
jgi:hypothetical protein